MIITKEIGLKDFEFWCCDDNFLNALTDDDWNTLESIIENEYQNGIDETELNDLFRFEDETIANWLGFSCVQELITERNN